MRNVLRNHHSSKLKLAYNSNSVLHVLLLLRALNVRSKNGNVLVVSGFATQSRHDGRGRLFVLVPHAQWQCQQHHGIRRRLINHERLSIKCPTMKRQAQRQQQLHHANCNCSENGETKNKLRRSGRIIASAAAQSSTKSSKRYQYGKGINADIKQVIDASQTPETNQSCTTTSKPLTTTTTPSASSTFFINSSFIDTTAVNSPPTIRNKSLNDILLLDIGPLVKGRVIKRPSAIIKSPYVADVQLCSNHENTTTSTTTTMEKHDGKESPDVAAMVLAHAPALDVGGLCSPGAIVFMSQRACCATPPTEGNGNNSNSNSKNNNSKTKKTSHSIELVLSCNGRGTEDECSPDKHQDVRQEEIPNGDASHCGMLVKNSNGVTLVGAHPRLGELLAQRVLELGLLESCIGFGPASLLTSHSKNKKSNAKTKSEKESICNGVLGTNNDKNHCSTKKKMDAFCIDKNNPENIELHNDQHTKMITTTMTKQVTYGDSRIDFVLESNCRNNDEVKKSNEANKKDNEKCIKNKKAFIEVPTFLNMIHNYLSNKGIIKKIIVSLSVLMKIIKNVHYSHGGMSLDNKL